MRLPDQPVPSDRPAQPSGRSPRPGRVVGALVAGALLAACAPGAASSPTTTAPSTTPAFPVTVENCGFPVELTEPPQRIVAIKSSAIEMLLALGVGDRVVGTGFPDGPPPAGLDGADLPLLSDRVPSAEVVLATEPDLVYAGWESNLTADGAGDRAVLADLGVATYVSPSACKDPAHQPDRLTSDELFAEVAEIAALLGVSEAADALVAEQASTLASVVPDDRGLTVLWYSSGTDVPYVGAGIGAPQLIMDTVGLTNIAGSVQDTWTPFSWEQVAQDDPDVIVLVDAAWNTAEDKRRLLATQPATAQLSAVLAERYLVVPFAATEAGVRTVPAAADLAAQLAELER